MDNIVFISGKENAAEEHTASLHDFENISRVLTEEFDFFARNDKQGFFDFFYHPDFKSQMLHYSGGQLWCKNPDNDFLELMIRISNALPDAEVSDNGGRRYLSASDIVYPEITFDDAASIVTPPSLQPSAPEPAPRSFSLLILIGILVAVFAVIAAVYIV